jgi:hypothetical protein
MYPIYEFGTQAQKEKYLPWLGKFFRWMMQRYIDLIYIAEGELIGAFVRVVPTNPIRPLWHVSPFRVSPNLIMVQTLQGWKPLQKKLTADSFLMEVKPGFPMLQ